MTKRSSARGSYTRRSRRVYVTTQRDPEATSSLARVLTNAALSRAQREATAEADHQASASTGSPATPADQATSWETRDA